MTDPSVPTAPASIEHLLVFTRYPVPGQTKTRLSVVLGAEGAANLQRQMTEHTLAQVSLGGSLVSLTRSRRVTVVYSGGDRAAMATWLGEDWHYLPQGDGDLGDRLIRAFQFAFEAGATAVIVIGIDCPELDAERLDQAFAALKSQDVVLGPATDGGYYLMGLRQPHPELFQGIDWGTDRVWAQTIAVAQSQGLAITTLPALTDVDRPADLPVWNRVRSRRSPGSMAPILSVIVPTLNEAKTLHRAIVPLLTPNPPLPLEIIVVDGGSTDETVAVAEALGVRVITSASGRATQMNAGAAAAQGEILLFLHADTRLPVEALPQMPIALAQSHVVAGAFELQIEGSDRGLRWVEWGVNWRSRWWHMPYGDQAMFLRAQIFHQLGGFADLPIMEDFELVQRLQRHGRIAILPAAVLTSGRRWQRLGIVKTTMFNQIMVLGYYLGIAPARLARWYRQGTATRQV